MQLKRKQGIDSVIGRIGIAILRVPVYLIGLISRRDHSPALQGPIMFIKMQGGGSLVLALPAIASIREAYPDNHCCLLTVTSLKPFADSLGVFDEIICVDESNIIAMGVSSFRAMLRSFRMDTVVDLEVYSRMTTVFSALTMARNRIGFYLENTFWRRGIHTHLIFLNRFSCVGLFYEEIARYLGVAEIKPARECSASLRKQLIPIDRDGSRRMITIGHGCSELGTERMLTGAQWLRVFQNKRVRSEEVVFLGGAGEQDQATIIIGELESHFPGATFRNECGRLSLIESVSCIDASDAFWGIDSALLHYARLLGKNTVSFWGPTDPRTRLRDEPGLESEIYYHKVLCSPCIHVAEEPPCHGNNICIKAIFDREDKKNNSLVTHSRLSGNDS
jgi:ADP-heptose:LPS heptosyltransferase